MSLAYKVDSLEGLDPAIAELYSKADEGEGFVLGVTGVVDKTRLDEFRSTNIQLLKEKDDAAAAMDKYKDVDLDAYKKMVADAKKLKDKEVIRKKDVDKMVQDRVHSMRVEFDTSTAELSKKLEQANKSLDDRIMDSQVRDAAMKHKVSASAVSDVISRARGTFSVTEGKLVATDGTNPLYGKDGVSPLSVGEWVKGLQTDAPHLFAQSTGGGARGSGASAGDIDKMSPTQKIEAGFQAM